MKISELFAARLYEGSLRPEYSKLSKDQFMKLLHSRCKNALWMLEENKPLWRAGYASDIRANKYSYVDSSATERKSFATSNHYTSIFDNHPEMEDFPKRGRSFIGASDFDIAFRGYSGYNIDNVYAMIPYDDAKIGVVGEADIWEITVDLFGVSEPLHVMNDEYFSALHGGSIEDFYDFDESLKRPTEDHDIERLKRFKKIFSWGDPKKYLESVFAAYSPKKTGFKWYYSSNLPKNLQHTEIWISGKMLIVIHDTWKKLINGSI